MGHVLFPLAFAASDSLSCPPSNPFWDALEGHPRVPPRSGVGQIQGPGVAVEVTYPHLYHFTPKIPGPVGSHHLKAPPSQNPEVASSLCSLNPL